MIDTGRIELLVAAAKKALPELPAPCFGVLGVEIGGRVRTHLVGPQTSIQPEVSILDWRTAPLAQLMFAHDPGEDFELELDGRTLEGRVVDKALLGLEGGELVEIERKNERLIRPLGEAWRADAPARCPILEPRPPELRGAELSLLPKLDSAQQAAVDRPADRTLLVLGEAGFGKTTVALHRLARLESRADAFRGLVIVPTPGLVRLSRLLLERLGARRTEVATFDDWIRAEARRVFALPKRDSEDTSAQVIRLKRHPALRTVLAEIARKARVKVARRKDLLHLFGDAAILKRVVEASDGALTLRAVAEVLEHTHVQFSKTTERAHAHVDADRLETVDGRRIDEGTPLGDAESIDAEDCAVLFELQRLRTGSSGVRKYSHVVIDEAQEFAPIELAALGGARGPGCAFTVAGDEHQQVDDTACFPGWAGAMSELQSGVFETVLLTESYRCPPDVTRFARGLFEPGTPRTLPEQSASLRVTRASSPCHVTLRLVDEIRALEAADPRATIAVVLRTPEGARGMHSNLSRVLAARLALNGDFDFLPGLVVTAVEEVKGLEFDVVIVPDAEPASYPDTVEARKALYVAVTRAIHRLWLVTPGAWSRLVAGP
jgi:DNA helicase IV